MGLLRTGVVPGIYDSQALWGEGRKRYRQILTIPTRTSVMADAKCRFCDHAADAGACCSTWTAAIMAKALNPFFGGKRKKGASWSYPREASAQRSLFR